MLTMKSDDETGVQLQAIFMAQEFGYGIRVGASQRRKRGSTGTRTPRTRRWASASACSTGSTRGVAAASLGELHGPCFEEGTLDRRTW